MEEPAGQGPGKPRRQEWWPETTADLEKAEGFACRPGTDEHAVLAAFSGLRARLESFIVPTFIHSYTVLDHHRSCTLSDPPKFKEVVLSDSSIGNLVDGSRKHHDKPFVVFGSGRSGGAVFLCVALPAPRLSREVSDPPRTLFSCAAAMTPWHS